MVDSVYGSRLQGVLVVGGARGVARSVSASTGGFAILSTGVAPAPLDTGDSGKPVRQVTSNC
jgi:hypothetical protein